MEKLDKLIEYLLKEDQRKIENLPTDEVAKKRLYRALVNIREAKPISPEFLKLEDEYLQEELTKKQVTHVDDIKTMKERKFDAKIVNRDKIALWQGDITTLKIDAVINAANSQGLGCFIPNHNCIDNQIQTFAGVRLRLACNDIMKTKDYHLPTGKSIITKGYNLPAKYVIHTVGPIIEYNVTKIKEDELASCYQTAMELAIQNDIKTMAFPCISTGVFRFPKELASEIAIETVDELLGKYGNKIDKVVFNLWREEDVHIYEQNIKKN